MKYKFSRTIILSVLLLTFSEKAMSMEFLFSDKKYQSNIQVESYILIDSQIPNLFAAQSTDIKQLPNDKLITTNNYMVVRLKNIGNKAAWGKLLIKVNDVNYVNLQIHGLGANMSKYAYYIIPFSLSLPKNDSIPMLTFEWDSLYSK